MAVNRKIDEALERLTFQHREEDYRHHTYDEDMAKELAERIYVYEALLQAWYKKMVNA